MFDAVFLLILHLLQNIIAMHNLIPVFQLAVVRVLWTFQSFSVCLSVCMPVCLLLLLLLNVFDDAPVCRHVKDESWASTQKLN